MASAFLITGTTKPFGAETAIEISAKSLNTISSPSIRAFTDGNSFNASQTALVKKDMNPNPTPCFSLNLSLYLARMSIIGCISTSLKVVSMAVSFLTETKRFATVFLKEDIFSRLSTREPGTETAIGATATGALSAFLEASALSASSLVNLPPTPVPLTLAASTPFSAKILAAEGDGTPEA